MGSQGPSTSTFVCIISIRQWCQCTCCITIIMRACQYLSISQVYTYLRDYDQVRLLITHLSECTLMSLPIWNHKCTIQKINTPPPPPVKGRRVKKTWEFPFLFTHFCLVSGNSPKIRKICTFCNMPARCAPRTMLLIVGGKSTKLS